MEFKLVAAVGEGKANRPTDLAQVRDLLNRVPATKGGPSQPLPEDDLARLIEAIATFQTAHLKELKLKAPDRVVDRAGATLGLLYANATPIPGTVKSVLPDACHFKQGDRRWSLVNLNNTRSIEYTYWWRGCALTAVAAAFAAKGFRLPDVAKIEERARKKHEASKRHEANPDAEGRKVADLNISDFGAINPLTLDSWMTENNSQGFASPGSAELDWTKIAGVSPRITFGAWLKPDDRRFPSPALLRQWLDQGTCVIGNVHGGEHFVVLTGYKGETTFLVYDVAFPDTESSFDAFVLLVTYTFS